MKREDAIIEARKHFPDNLSADVFISKYAIVDNNGDYTEVSLDDMRKRLATAMVEIESKHNKSKWYSKRTNPTYAEYEELLHYFLFGGRTLYALGNPYDKKASFSNCYVVPILEDSVEGIMQCATETAVTYRGGGGVGIDITPLRSEGMKVSNGAKTTTGAISFVELYSLLTGIIGMHGRRGALMITLAITHPDIIKFIKLKGGDDIEVAKHCNMSILVTNKFMDLVVNGMLDAEWETSFTTSKGETFSKMYTVGEIWNLFIEASWKRAEPSLLYWDNIQNGDPSNVIPKFKAKSTNPCVTGDTWVDTTEGRIQVKDLIGKKFKAVVQHQEYNSISDGFFYTGHKEIIKLKFKSGIELKCTPDHLIQVFDETYGVYLWVEAQDLTNTYRDLEVVLNGKTHNGSIRTDVIERIDDIDVSPEDVYDCTIEDVHCFSANGVIVHNCSEIPLESYGACNIASINLSDLVINEFVRPEFNYEKFKQVIKLGVRALDLIIDENLNRQPLEQQKVTMRDGRRIGLGFTGYGDMLSKLGMTYGSDKAIKFTDDMLLFFQREVLKSEILLAREKGAFPEFYNLSKEMKQEYLSHSYFDVLCCEWKALLHKYGVRNVSFTTVAPNGTLSIILGNTTSGIEPLFQRSYTRKVKTSGVDEVFTVHHTLVERWLKLFKYNDEYSTKCFMQWNVDNIPREVTFNDDILNTTNVWEYLKLNNHTESEIEKIKSTVQDYMLHKIFVQADEVDWFDRIKTQAVIQKHISHAISSTINLPSNVEQSVVSNIYIEAYKHGLKGVTVYRDGCRGNILSKIDDNPKVKIEPVKTVKMLSEYDSKSITIKSYENVDFEKMTDENYTKKWYLNFWIDKDTKLPVAIFVNTNSKNKEKTLLISQTIEVLNKLAEKYIPRSVITDNTDKIKNESNIDKLARVLSMLLRHFVPISEIINEITKISPPLGSFVFHVKHALASFIDGQITGETCSECGEKLYHENGCTVCKNCGYSKCQ